MKVGIALFMLRPERMSGAAQRAEELGYESVWVPEHLVFPSTIRSTYPYAKDGVPPINPATPLLDPLLLLAHIAARTSRIRLGTNIYILPLRHPIESARLAMTLDVLSQGRLAFGIGAGWLAEEFEAVGIAFDTRAARTRECVRAMKALWTQDDTEFHGKFFNFGPVKFEPKPVQKPHPPFIFGGESDAALKRAAALGDGWYGVGHSPESATVQVRKLHEHLAAQGRRVAGFEITVSCGVPSLSPDDVARYEEGGVHRVVLVPWRRGREADEAMTRQSAVLSLAR